MAEHVGRSRLGEYFATVYKQLRPGGLFLNHAISDQSDGRRKRRMDPFIARYVFPDGELIPIGETLEAAERAGFEVRDVENLREHYHRTLQLWNARLLEHRSVAAAIAGDESYRIFRTSFAASALATTRHELYAQEATDSRLRS